jgi:hypothetical protein
MTLTIPHDALARQEQLSRLLQRSESPSQAPSSASEPESQEGAEQ